MKPAPRLRFTVNSEIPAVCTDADLMWILDIGHTSYGERKKAGEFAPLILRSPNGSTDGVTKYSGHLIARWLNGERIGQSESRQFLTSARRQRAKAAQRAGHGGQQRGSQPVGESGERAGLAAVGLRSERG